MAVPSTEVSRTGWAVVAVVTLASLLPSLDSSIMTVANARIAVELPAGIAALQWMTNAYLLALTAMMVPAGKLGDLFGRRKVFLVGVAGFALASVGISLSAGAGELIAFRVLQGAFGAFVSTTALSLIRSSVPAASLASGIGVFSSVQGLSVAAGPVVGGVIVSDLGWRWAFGLNVPVAAACVVATFLVVGETSARARPRFDIAGAALLVGALAALSLGLVRVPTAGWGDPLTIGLVVTSVVAGTLFVVAELRAADPVVPLTLFRTVSIAAATVLSVLAFFAMNGSLFFLTLYWQHVQHTDATTAGLNLLPLGLGLFLAASVSGRVSRRLGDRAVLIIGCLLMAAGLAATSLVDAHSGYPVLGVGLGVLGIGLGLMVPTVTTVAVGRAPKVHSGAAAGLQNTATRLGGVLGISVLGAIMASTSTEAFRNGLSALDLPPTTAQLLDDRAAATVAEGVAPHVPGSAAVQDALRTLSEQSFVHGMHITMVAGALFCVAGAVTALFIRRP
jgi:EmrB/QacA subfamily drug resistance transporter